MTGPPLNQPFFQGALTVPGISDSSLIYQIGLFGRPYFIDVRRYERFFLDPYRNAQDTSSLPGEQTLSTEGVWVRFGTDWRFGAGQARFDDQDADRRRFSDSFGVDVWTQGQVSLLNDTEVLWANASAVLKMVVTSDDRLVVAQAAGVTVIAAGTPTSVTGILGTVTDIDVDDTTIYIATSTNVMAAPLSTLVAANFSTPVTGNHTMVLLANGRLVAGRDNTLIEISSTGTVTTATTHVSSAFRFTVAAAHPQWIYAGGSIGSKFELFRFGVDPTTGNLDGGVQALFLPGGELVNDMIAYVGAIVLATTRGVRLALVDANGNLEYGPVIEQPGDVKALFPVDDFVYFSWTQVTTARSGIGRLLPSRFTSTLVPAWASDLTYDSTATVTAVAEHQGKVCFAVSGVGVVTEDTDNLMASGWLDTGEMSFGIPYTTTLIDLTLRSEPLEGTVSAFFTMADNLELSLGVHGVAGSIESSKLPFPVSGPYGAETDRVSLRLLLSREDATHGPVLKQWLLRTAPQPDRVERIVLPILLYSTIEPNDEVGPIVDQDVIGEVQRIRSLIQSGRIVTYQEGSASYRVRVTNMRTDVERGRWTSDGQFFEHTLLTQLEVMNDG